MKRIVYSTSKLFLAIGLFWISAGSSAQEAQLSKQERKEERKAQLTANFQALDTLLTSKKFVLEADYLQNNYGARIQIPTSLNFIKVDTMNAILQTGYYYGLGYNGVGGVTAEGILNNWKLYKDPKHLSYNLRFSVNTNIGIYDVSMTVSADNYVRAIIDGLRPGELIYEGHLQTIENSPVFKGRQTF